MRAFIILMILSLSFTKTAFGDYNTEYDEHFRKYSKLFFGVGFDWRWFKAQAIAESNLQPKGKSTKNAKGIMQILPSTYNMMRKKYLKVFKKNIYNPRSNIGVGIAYNLRIWKKWQEIDLLLDRLNFTFASYNAGYSTILRAKKISIKDGAYDKTWNSIEKIAPKVRKWNQGQTLHYIHKINDIHEDLKKTDGKIKKKLSLLHLK